MEQKDVDLLGGFQSLTPSEQVELLKRNESVTPSLLEEVKQKPAVNIDAIELEHYRKMLDLKVKVANMVVYFVLIVSALLVILSVVEIVRNGNLLNFVKGAVDIGKVMIK